MDEPAFVHALPVLREEFSVRVGFHCCVKLLSADNAFHQAGLLINQFSYVLFLGHHPVCPAGWQK